MLKTSKVVVLHNSTLNPIIERYIETDKTFPALLDAFNKWMFRKSYNSAAVELGLQSLPRTKIITDDLWAALFMSYCNSSETDTNGYTRQHDVLAFEFNPFFCLLMIPDPLANDILVAKKK